MRNESDTERLGALVFIVLCRERFGMRNESDTERKRHRTKATQNEKAPEECFLAI